MAITQTQADLILQTICALARNTVPTEVRDLQNVIELTAELRDHLIESAELLNKGL